MKRSFNVNELFNNNSSKNPRFSSPQSPNITSPQQIPRFTSPQIPHFTSPTQDVDDEPVEGFPELFDWVVKELKSFKKFQSFPQ